MAYSDREIRNAITAGSIVVRPFCPEAINGASLDVRLGQWCYRIAGPDALEGSGRVLNPFDEEVVAAYFRLDRAAPLPEVVGRDGVPYFVRGELEQLRVVSPW